MIANWLKAAARMGLRALVLVAVVGAAQFAYLSWQGRALVRSIGSAPSGSAGQLQFALPALASKLLPNAPRDVLSPDRVPAAGAPQQQRRRQIYLVVSVGAERSEVVINGITRGHTPYVGEIHCEPEGKLSITVMPPRGMPKTFERLCDRTEIRIVDDESP